MTAKIFLKYWRLGGAISKNGVKLSQWGCFFIYFDEKYDNNFFQRNTGN